MEDITSLSCDWSPPQNMLWWHCTANPVCGTQYPNPHLPHRQSLWVVFLTRAARTSDVSWAIRPQRTLKRRLEWPTSSGVNPSSWSLGQQGFAGKLRSIYPNASLTGFAERRACGCVDLDSCLCLCPPLLPPANSRSISVNYWSMQAVYCAICGSRAFVNSTGMFIHWSLHQFYMQRLWRKVTNLTLSSLPVCSLGYSNSGKGPVFVVFEWEGECWTFACVSSMFSLGSLALQASLRILPLSLSLPLTRDQWTAAKCVCGLLASLKFDGRR